MKLYKMQKTKENGNDMENQQLLSLAAMSNRYGANPAYVLAGGGNTSYKSEKLLWVKGSGTSLATIKAEDFVVLEREKLDKMWTANYPEKEADREAAVLADMMAARVPGETRRPSVETLLHNLFPQKFVLHVHPALVNGLTCSQEGEKAMKRLFPKAVWVDACKPGYILALDCREKMNAYTRETGEICNLLFLQNHGIFFAGDTVEAIDEIANMVMDALSKEVSVKPNLDQIAYDAAYAARLQAKLEALCGAESAVCFTASPAVLAYDPATKSVSPDHIVYAKAKQLAIQDEAELEAAFAAFVSENGYQPRIVFVAGLGMFACGTSKQTAATAQVVMLDAIQVVSYAEAFGGVSPMTQELIDFIVNWEVESYRSKVSLGK